MNRYHCRKKLKDVYLKLKYDMTLYMEQIGISIIFIISIMEKEKEEKHIDLRNIRKRNLKYSILITGARFI